MRFRKTSISLAPTDLSNFLSCRHLSHLDLGAAKGLAERPVRYGPLVTELRARGLVHEKMYLEHLQEQDLTIVRVGDSDASSQSTLSSNEKTIAAMRSGVDVIYQATLADNSWYGNGI